MTPKYFKCHNVVIAKDQPEYIPLPARVENGVATFCWQLSWRERVRLLLRGEIWHQVMTFNGPLQPQKLSTKNPFDMQQEGGGNG
jgi:hypothetical protein